MKKTIVLTIALFMVIFGTAFAQSTSIIAHDWGGLSYRSNGMVIDVRHELTTEKAGLSEFFTEGYGQATKLATEEAKKLLSIIYNIVGVANIRFSSYQILIITANMFTPEEIAPKIEEAMTNWHQTIKKEK